MGCTLIKWFSGTFKVPIHHFTTATHSLIATQIEAAAMQAAALSTQTLEVNRSDVWQTDKLTSLLIPLGASAREISISARLHR